MSVFRPIGAAVAALLSGLLCPTPAVAIADPAGADCGDPGRPPCGGPAPTAEQAADVVSRLTDPQTPDPAKSALVEGGLSGDELGRLHQQISGLDTDGALPFAVVVSDIQPAPNDLAGTTVSLSGHHVSIPVVRPLVFVRHGDSWLLTHDSYDPTFTQELQWILDRVGSPVDGGFYGGPPLPPFGGAFGR